MWDKALSFVGSIFGSSESTNKALDMVNSGIDAAWFTPEEKSQAAFKKLQLQLELIKATSGQNLARRVIAFVIVSIWSYLVLLAVHLHLFGYIEQATFVFNVLKDVVGWSFVAIISFYFLVQFTRNK